MNDREVSPDVTRIDELIAVVSRGDNQRLAEMVESEGTAIVRTLHTSRSAIATVPFWKQHWRKLVGGLGVVMVAVATAAKTYFKEVLEQQLWYATAIESALHVGIALIIAVSAALAFERMHQKELIGGPLAQINEEMEKLGAAAKDANSRAATLARTVASLNNAMDFSLNQGIEEFLIPGTQEWQRAIERLIRESHEFIYLQGRTLGPFLVKEHHAPDSGWLGDALEDRMNRRGAKKPDVSFLLANVFDQNTGFRGEIKAMLAAGDQERERANGRQAVSWVLNQIEAMRARKEAPEWSLRWLSGIPPVFAVITDGGAVVGNYVRFHTIDKTWMQRLCPHSDLYNAYVEQFCELFAAAESDLQRGIARRMARHANDNEEIAMWTPLLEVAKTSCTGPRMAESIKRWEEKLAKAGVLSDFRDNHRMRNFAGDQGIVAMYWRKDDEFHQAVINAVEECDDHIWIMGRTHSAMLGNPGMEASGKNKRPWLLPTLVRRLKDSPAHPVFHCLFPDVFTSADNSYRKELRRMVPDQPNAHHWTRETSDALMKSKLDCTMDDKSFDLRFVDDNIPCCMLVTEKRAFVEHYLPAQQGGALCVMEILAPSDDEQTEDTMYARYKKLFVQLWDDPATKKAVDVYRDYLDTADHSELNKKRKKLIDDIVRKTSS